MFSCIYIQQNPLASLYLKYANVDLYSTLAERKFKTLDWFFLWFIICGSTQSRNVRPEFPWQKLDVNKCSISQLTRKILPRFKTRSQYMLLEFLRSLLHCKFGTIFVYKKLRWNIVINGAKWWRLDRGWRGIWKVLKYEKVILIWI